GTAGLGGGVVAETVQPRPGGQGLSAATAEYEDLVAAGIIDPVKVTRSALQNAASIAGRSLTTEAVVADEPEPEAPAAAGGMGGMGGMGGRMCSPDHRPPRPSARRAPILGAG